MQGTKALAAGRDHRGRWGGEPDGHFHHHFPAAEGNTVHPTSRLGRPGCLESQPCGQLWNLELRTPALRHC